MTDVSRWLRYTAALTIPVLIMTACGGDPAPQSFQATLPGRGDVAPVYTETPTLTPTFTLSPTFTNTPTLTPTNTLTPTATLTPSQTPTPSDTPTLTPSPTLTSSPTPTPPLFTLTPASAASNPAATVAAASFSADEGWSCGVYPCEDDIDGFLERIRVPPGFTVEHVGRIPGQPQQITYGRDGRLYATTILDVVDRRGAVVALGEGGEPFVLANGLLSPVGLAFQPGTDVLYVSARETLESGGVIYRLLSDGSTPRPVIEDLPCCWREIDNQVNGMVFGPDGHLYVGVSSLTDHAEPDDPRTAQFSEPAPLEASVLRVQPHTGNVETFAEGVRHPFDVTFDSSGQFYATDSGVLSGPGDRLLALTSRGHHGFPYWRALGCVECPPTRRDITYTDALLPLPNYTLPRGLVAYKGGQYPASLFDQVFVALWHEGQVVRVPPDEVPTDPAERAAYQPTPFITGLIRPIDVTHAPDGSLVVVDSVYGHVWRVRYMG